MNGRAITVSQLNNYIKQVFDAEELLHGIEVVGDIDGIRVSGGAAYFTLKDEAACIPCVCYYPAKLRGTENGAKVVVRGTVSYWHKAGKISFVVSSIESFGFGALFLRLQQLKEKLQAEGIFDAGVKKALPSQIRRIGVVTSRTGAVIHDIIRVAHRRNPAVDIVLYPASVQGEGAEAQIAQGIKFFSATPKMSGSPVDVIIVARGGGSKEDLSAFNSESVARAVFASKIPVVSAVGHETDFTLIDLAADLRAPTPSAAAELCVPESLTKREIAMRAYSHLRYALKNKAETLVTKILTGYASARAAVTARIADSENRIAVLAGYVESNNPLAVLRRGYAKVYAGADEITDAGKVKIGDELQLRLYNGGIDATVTRTHKRGK
jgi:exodeoxyribonuclease VII large subunit